MTACDKSTGISSTESAILENYNQIPLFVEFTEVDINDYRDSTFCNHSIKRIAHVTLNPTLLEPQKVRSGDYFLLNLFDDTYVDIIVEEILESKTLSIKGHQENDLLNGFLLVGDERLAYATFEMVEANLIYTIKSVSGLEDIYLVETAIDIPTDIESEALPVSEENTYRLNNFPESYFLILGLEELTRYEFVNQFGFDYLMQDHTTAVSEKIARVIINTDILKADLIRPGDQLSVRVYDDISYNIIIDDTTSFSDTFSMRGSIETPVKGMFMLAITNNQALASLRFEETDSYYLLKYNIHDQEHYLFKTSYHLVNYFNEGGDDICEEGS